MGAVGRPAPPAPPPSIGWHAAFWADDPAWSRPADGAAVSSWREYGGTSARDLAQATSGKQPVLRAAVTALGGRSAVEFDGSNDSLASSAWTALGQPVSLVLICNVAAVPASFATWMSGRLSSGTMQLFAMDTAGTRKWAVGASSNQIVAAATVTTGGHAMRGLITGSSSALNVDGTVTTSASNIGSDLCNGLRLGANSSDANPANIAVAFAGVYSGNVTSNGGWAAFCAWVGAHYGLTLA